MDPFLTAFIATAAGLLVGVPIGFPLTLLLVPGRKGTMRSERQMSLGGADQQAARATAIELLQREGFAIDVAAADVILGTRQGAGLGNVYTHADKTMRAEIRLRAGAADTRATVAVWLRDFILYDTGESRVVDQQLERFLHGPSAVPPEPVPTSSLLAISALVSGGVAIALLAAIAAGDATPARVGVLAGVAFAAASNVFIAIRAALMIRRRPAELTGRSVAIAAVALAILGLIGCGLVASGRYRDAIRQRATALVDRIGQHRDGSDFDLGTQP